MDYKKICDEVSKLAIETGKYIRHEHDNFDTNKIEIKGKNDFVSYVDKTSEKKIVEQLSKIVPEAGFIAEEGTRNDRGDIYNWIVDPLDGTTNFIHGIFPVCISIALQENNKTVVGVVYEIGLDECFAASKGNGAYLNNKQIFVSKRNNLKDSLIATGFPYYDFSRQDKFMKSMADMMINTHGMRRLGSAATDLAYTACGRFEAFYEYGLHPWDVAAGAFIVEEAGGKVCDFNGEDNYIFGGEIIAAGNNVYDEFLNKVKNYMK
ncbi:MAG: inositol monophosphatase [Bacteroidales bacterium]|nr:inositol monophosphatase [Bacteroidales bacterium]